MKLIRKPQVWLLVLIVIQMAVNLVWLSMNQIPPAWDQAAHLRLAVMFGQKMAGVGENGWVQIIREGYGYPPLIYFLGGIWSLIAGIGIKQITLVNSLFLAGLLMGVYKLGKVVFRNDWWALVTATMVSLIPVVYDISRNFLLDLPLMTWVVWGLYFYWVSGCLSRRKEAMFWGLMLVLASLTKLNGFIYFGPMVLWSLLQWWRRKDENIFLNLTIVGLGWLFLVGWWWIVNWQNIVNYLTGLAGQGEKLTDPMNLTEWQTWIHYVRLFFWNQVTPVAAIIIAFLLISKVKIGKFWWWWLLVNYVIFTVIKNKDFRFTMPMLPVVGLLAVNGFQYWWQKRRDVFWLLAVLLAGYWVWFLVNNSFGWPVKKPLSVSAETFIMGNGDLINITDYPVASPRRERWPNEELIRDLWLKARAEGRQRVLVLLDRQELNDNNLKLYRDLMTTGGEKMVELHSVFEANFNRWGDFEMILVPETGVEPAPFYVTNLEYLRQARDYVWQHQTEFGKEKEYELPSGGKAVLFRRI